MVISLFIDGKRAALKEGLSFDYVFENRSFTDSDGYSMEIVLPLAGSPENLAIFGNLNRLDCGLRRRRMEAELVCVGVRLRGVVTVVDMDESEVKVQFLEGRSAQNFDLSLDDVFINELDLGVFPDLIDMPGAMLDPFGDFVCLPWVNESCGSVINNEILTGSDGLVWGKDTLDAGGVSFMPYLIFVAKRVCGALGLSYDFSEWEASGERFLLVCNVLPYVWDVRGVARVLPHWSVSEFFEELERVLVAEFDVDLLVGRVSMRFCSDIVDLGEGVVVEDVVDEFSAEVSEDEGGKARFRGVANLLYADRGDEAWGFEQCEWLVSMLKESGHHYVEFGSVEEFYEWARERLGFLMGVGYTSRDGERGDDRGYLVYVRDDDAYYMMRVVPTVFHSIDFSSDTFAYEWIEVNRFGDVVYDKDSGNDVVLRCVPARVDVTDEEHGRCLFLSPAAYGEEVEDFDGNEVRQPVAYSMLLKGEPDSLPEYYGKLFLAYWDGTNVNGEGKAPCPVVDGRFSLRRRYKGYYSGLRVDPRVVLKVKWIGRSVPNVRGVFYIGGKRYLCGCIKAKFSDRGMSELLEGEFYQIV